MTEPTPKKFIFKQAEVGQPPSAENQNKVHEAINYAAGRPNVHPKKPTRAMKLMKMSEVLGQMGQGTQSDSSMAHRRRGVVQYYDPDLNDFTPTSDDETKNNITDAVGLPVDAEEKIWCVYLEQSGHWHPVNPRSIRTARTVHDESGNYPEAGANVYPVKYLRITYDKSPGLQTPSETFLDDNDERPDDVVLNLFEGNDCNPVPWIPPDTNIWMFNLVGHWYTWFDDCNPDDYYESSSGYPITPVIRFRLTADLTQTNNYSTAVVRNYNPLIADYEDGETIEVYDWYAFSQGERGMFSGKGNPLPDNGAMEGVALLKQAATGETVAKYDIIWMEQYAFAIEFTLSEDMGYTNPGEAQAQVTASWHQGVSPPLTLVVHDDQGRFTDCISGCKGTAWRSEYKDPGTADPYYKIVSCSRPAMQAHGTLSLAMCGNAPNVGGSFAIEPLGEYMHLDGPGRVLANTAGHYGMSGDYVVFERVTNTPVNGGFTWEVRDVFRHPYDVTLDLYITEGGGELRRTKVISALEICEEPTDEALLTFTDCENSSSSP